MEPNGMKIVAKCERSLKSLMKTICHEASVKIETAVYLLGGGVRGSTVYKIKRHLC